MFAFFVICRLPNEIFTVLTLKPGRFEEDGLITTFSENKKFSRFFFLQGSYFATVENFK